MVCCDCVLFAICCCCCLVVYFPFRLRWMHSRGHRVISHPIQFVSWCVGYVNQNNSHYKCVLISGTVFCVWNHLLHHWNYVYRYYHSDYHHAYKVIFTNTSAGMRCVMMSCLCGELRLGYPAPHGAPFRINEHQSSSE